MTTAAVSLDSVGGLMGAVVGGVVGAYFGCGVLFAALAGYRGVARWDEKVRGAPKVFWVLITPAMIALWPLVWRRLRVLARGGGEVRS